MSEPTGLNWHSISEPIPSELDEVLVVDERGYFWVADREHRSNETFTHWAEINGPGQPSPEAEQLRRLREAARKYMDVTEGCGEQLAEEICDCEWANNIASARAALEKDLNR